MPEGGSHKKSFYPEDLASRLVPDENRSTIRPAHNVLTPLSQEVDALPVVHKLPSLALSFTNLDSLVVPVPLVPRYLMLFVSV